MPNEVRYDGASAAIFFRALFRTVCLMPVMSWTSDFACCGQLRMQRPQRMHSSSITSTLLSLNLIDFTGQTLRHLWQFLQLAFATLIYFISNSP